MDAQSRCLGYAGGRFSADHGAGECSDPWQEKALMDVQYYQRSQLLSFTLGRLSSVPVPQGPTERGVTAHEHGRLKLVSVTRLCCNRCALTRQSAVLKIGKK
jgi:hypothetical protein